MAVGEISAARVARNDARFRTANEELEASALELGFDPDERVPFLCECAEMTCTTVLQLTPNEYELVRRSPIRFINAHGHERSAQGWVRVVEELERYSVVEKLGEAAEIAADLDTRWRTGDGLA